MQTILKNGFRPNGDGPKGERYGRCVETSRAFKADGTVRAKRRTKSTAEKIAAQEEARRATYRTVGRDILKRAEHPVTSHVARFRKYLRDARGYATEEALAARRAYFEAQLAACDEKHARAAEWLPGAEAADEAVKGATESLGLAVAERMASGDIEKDSDITPEVAADIISEYLPEDAIATIASAADPEGDPFHGLRRADLSDGGESQPEDPDENL